MREHRTHEVSNKAGELGRKRGKEGERDREGERGE